MNSFEIENIKRIGLKPGEYEAIKNVTVDEILKQIPADENEAWELWKNGKVNLPHDGIYGSGEFSRHLKLAQFIRSFNPGNYVRGMTIRQFLRIVGPYGTVIL